VYNFERAAPYGAVPGWQIRPAQYLGDVFGVTDPNKCKALARAKGANAWGHRNALHGSAKYKNSCWFYKTAAGTKYAGNKGDKVHMIGCSVSGNPRTGCTPVPAKAVAKAKSIPYWKQIGGKLKQVSISGNKVCGVNSADNIYCKTNLHAGNWYQVHGKLKHISLSGNSLYGVNSADNIYYSPNMSAKAPWKQIGGKLKQVSHAGGKVCGVNSADNIYCKSGLTNSNWKQVPGKLKQVSVSRTGGRRRRRYRIYGVNSADNIYYASKMSGNWKQIGGKLKQVSMSGNNVCGVNSADNIYCKTNLTNSNWKQKPGKLKHISISGGRAYGVSSGDNIYYGSNWNR
jgi:hypothetical protein